MEYGLKSSSVETSSDVVDVYLGLRWRALKWLEVTGGFRNTRYTDVGVDLRPKISTDNMFDDGIVINLEDVTRVNRSATYEGFYGGVIIRLY